MGEKVTGGNDERNHLQSWKRKLPPLSYFELSPGGGDNFSSVVMLSF